MRQTVPTLRKAAIVLVAVCSVLCGVFLVWQLVTRESVAALSTGQLVGMLALFVLPAATFGAWELDRRAALRVEVEEALGAADEAAPRAVYAHEAGSESEPTRHRRRVVHAEAVARR